MLIVLLLWYDGLQYISDSGYWAYQELSTGVLLSPTSASDILYLLDKSPQLPTSTVQNYVLKCAVDGNEKPAIVKAIFDKGLNTSFFNELLSKYMNSSTDSNEVKAEITDILSGGGLKIDPSSFIEYICGTQADVPTKIQFIKKMKANGSQLRSDAASTYLERTAPNVKVIFKLVEKENKDAISTATNMNEADYAENIQ